MSRPAAGYLDSNLGRVLLTAWQASMLYVCGELDTSCAYRASASLRLSVFISVVLGTNDTSLGKVERNFGSPFTKLLYVDHVQTYTFSAQPCREMMELGHTQLENLFARFSMPDARSANRNFQVLEPCCFEQRQRVLFFLFFKYCRSLLHSSGLIYQPSEIIHLFSQMWLDLKVRDIWTVLSRLGCQVCLEGSETSSIDSRLFLRFWVSSFCFSVGLEWRHEMLHYVESRVQPTGR